MFSFWFVFVAVFLQYFTDEFPLHSRLSCYSVIFWWFLATNWWQVAGRAFSLWCLIQILDFSLNSSVLWWITFSLTKMRRTRAWVFVAIIFSILIYFYHPWKTWEKISKSVLKNTRISLGKKKKKKLIIIHFCSSGIKRNKNMHSKVSFFCRNE